MTAVRSIDPEQFLAEHLAQASPDLMRELLSTFIQTLLSADADAVCGAAYGSVSAERTNIRNGYRHRDLDTPPEGAPPGSAPSTSRSRSCARGPTSRSGCCSAGGGPRPR